MHMRHHGRHDDVHLKERCKRHADGNAWISNARRSFLIAAVSPTDAAPGLARLKGIRSASPGLALIAPVQARQCEENSREGILECLLEGMLGDFACAC